MGGEWPRETVLALERAGTLLVQDGNHGASRPLPHEIVENGIPHVRAADIGENGVVDLSGAQKLAESAWRRIKKGRSLPGDVLLTHKGTVGRVGIVPHDAKRVLCSPQTTFWRSLDPTRLDQGFLSAFLRSTPFQEQLRRVMHESDMAPYVSLTSQRALSVALPPPDEQRAIASVLGALDDKIDSNRRLALSMDWLADRTFHDRFGSLIEGETPLTELLDVVPGRSYKSSELADGTDTALLSLKSFAAGGGYKAGGLKPYSGLFKPQQVVVPGDVVMAVTDLTQAANVVGRVARVPSQKEFGTLVISLDVVALRPRSPAWTSYIIGLFQSRAWLQQAFGYANGSTVLHLSKSAFPEFLVRQPTDREVSELAAVCDPLHAQADALRTEARTLTTIRDALLPKLVSGQIRVPLSDDPAESLGAAVEALNGAAS